MKSIVMNCDCMEYMKGVPDGWFELAVVDPPYGIDINMNMGRRKGKRAAHDVKKWDNKTPDKVYFDELFRVSKNQIIWGGNYFNLPLTKSWIFWDKEVPVGVSFADGELAWTSFDKTLIKANIPYSGFVGSEGKIHPTQKPIRLYQWLYKNYLPAGGRVFDSHLGSGSNRIAADMAENIDFYACEIDKDYFDAQQKRFETYLKQPRIQFPEPIICEQSKLF